jgi:hypothetical protein
MDAQGLTPTPPAIPPSSPRPDSPGPETADPTPPVVPSIADPDRSERTPPPVGAFEFTGTSSPFITPAAIRYLQTVSGGQRWVEMVASYLRFEELPSTNGVCISPVSDASCIPY